MIHIQKFKVLFALFLSWSLLTATGAEPQGSSSGNQGNFRLGAVYDWDNSGVLRPTMGWSNDKFLVDVYFQYSKWTNPYLGAYPTQSWDVGGNIGMRSPLSTSSNISLIYGLQAEAAVFKHDNPSENDSSDLQFGAFVGVEYPVGKNWVLAGKMIPYEYQVDYADANWKSSSKKTHGFLSGGSCSLVYAF